MKRLLRPLFMWRYWPIISLLAEAGSLAWVLINIRYGGWLAAAVGFFVFGALALPAVLNGLVDRLKWQGAQLDAEIEAMGQS